MAKKAASSRSARTRQSKSTAKRDLVGGAAKRKRSSAAATRSSATAQDEPERERLSAGWRGSAKAYAALGLAKGLRAAARTISLARGQASSPKKS